MGSPDIQPPGELNPGAPPAPDFRAGFVSIVGKPNVGKSTLMNQLIGERLSIITSKAQTTRHRIMGILNGNHNGQPFQLVYSDTPGIIQPKYKLHESMMSFVRGSLEDADVILFVTDIFEQHDEDDVIKRLKYANVPIILLINKIDQASPEQVEEKIRYWEEHFSVGGYAVLEDESSEGGKKAGIPDEDSLRFNEDGSLVDEDDLADDETDAQPVAEEAAPGAPRKATEIIPISALNGFNLDRLFDDIVRYLPVHPPYFPEDELTDKPERFFASEMIREKIFLNYKKEVPYSSEVVITGFKDREDMLVISAEILVERPTQRAILLGEKGNMIKKTGIMAREELERFFGKKVFLETHVKVEPDWRQKERMLRRLGYDE
ncbi:GTP-binding protein [Fibrella aquatilis]|uniref:GTPase Era n=1 Tax=Fibrella aquatilis TaxID=2817059 RepID=A0A939G8R8_9BACT|nr:GTP-binding protein [Fibrella aquatilis]MBO0932714.1 GTP-binding protein [Fibrella aquatilis]